MNIFIGAIKRRGYQWGIVRARYANRRANSSWRKWFVDHEWEARADAWDAFCDREAALLNATSIAEAREQSAGASALIQYHIMAEVHSFPSLIPPQPDDPEYGAKLAAWHALLSSLSMEDRANRALVLHRLASAYRAATSTRLFAFGAPRVKEKVLGPGVTKVIVEWEGEETVDFGAEAEGVVGPPPDPPAAPDPATAA